MRADVLRGSNDVNHRRLSRDLAARSTSEAVGPERRQRPSSDLRRSPAPAKDRPSRATRLLASESTPRGDILALQPVHRSRWTACRRGSAAPPTMVLEENIRVSGVSLSALRGGLGSWRSRKNMAQQNKPPAPCSVLFWPVLEHPQNRVLSVLPPLTFFGRQATAGPRKGGAAGRRPGFLRGTASKPAEGAEKKIQKISEVASPTKYLLC